MRERDTPNAVKRATVLVIQQTVSVTEIVMHVETAALTLLISVLTVCPCNYGRGLFNYDSLIEDTA